MAAFRIVAPANFRHAGNLPGWYSKDPRRAEFEPSEVQIDFRACEFAWPSAVAWCAVYCMLTRRLGRHCELLVPENRGVATYLKSTGLFRVLQEVGVELDDRGLGDGSSNQTIIPLSRFNTETEGERLANLALERLGEYRLGAANLHSVVAENFAELAFNVAQHSESPIGGVGLVQFFDFREGPRFTIVVADGGIGIRSALWKNQALRTKIHYDWTAIELASRERISGTGEATRGIGLYGVAEDARRGGRQLIIHSGIGVLEISEDVRQDSRRTNLFPGTICLMSIAG
ncbi:MAG: hypothetical protein HY682_05715 [Chloroflexi bacterium]|nr:hypothetical protein [Chloroflexota bacterium]